MKLLQSSLSCLSASSGAVWRSLLWAGGGRRTTNHLTNTEKLNFVSPGRWSIRQTQIRRWVLICATLSLQLLAICLLFSEAIFTGHSGYWHRPTLCTDAAETRTVFRVKLRSPPGRRAPTPGRWLRRRAPMQSFPLIFAATQSPPRALTTIFYHRKWHGKRKKANAQN